MTASAFLRPSAKFQFERSSSQALAGQMIADTARIRSRLEGLQYLPTPVRSWVVEEGVDWMDNPAVWVWALLDRDDVDMDSQSRLQSIVRKAVRDATGLWTYVLIRGADEPEATS